ncbi:hypothetical protein JTB14_028971 [Gonioctena quinquepunctata]|nr:hypothetical protein JTB14_028971 [Gonioctena quinquepunctata]
MFRKVELLLYFTFVVGKITSENDCDTRVKNEFDYLRNSFVTPSNFSIPSSFNEINDLLKRLDILISSIGLSDDMEKKQKNITNVISQIYLLNEEVRKGIEFLKAGQNKLEAVKSKRIMTMNQCGTARKNYNKLMNDFDAVEKIGLEIDDKIDNTLKRVEATKESSMSIRNKLGGVRIPDYVSAKYLCNNKLAVTIRELIVIAKRIRELISQQKENVYKKLENVNNKIHVVGKPVGNIPESVLEGGSELIIKQLQQKIINLENDIEKIEVLKVPVSKWDAIMERLRQRSQKDIKMATEIYELLQQKQRAKKAFNGVQNTVTELCKRGVCNITGPVKVEQ